MRFLIGLLALAGCADAAVPAAGGLAADTLATGTVVSVDASPMAYDADGLVELLTDGDDRLTVHVPARQNLCTATGLGLLGELKAGDRVEVRGEVRDGDQITPCSSPDHGIQRLATAGGVPSGTYRGVFVSGFETSAFHPCDRPGEVWWFRGNKDFSDRFEAIRQRHAPTGGRGLRLFVETTIVGDLESGDRYGHLGAYRQQVRVRETRDMMFLAANPDTDPSCQKP